MCDECHMTPCHPRCPNAPEIKPVYVCEICGYGIYEGEKFFDGPKGYICEECMEEMSAGEFLEMFDKHMKIA